MTKTLPIILLLLSSFFSYGQDLIVTLNNDSLNCKIDRTNEEHILFKHIHRHRLKLDSLPNDSLKTFVIGYYKQLKEQPKTRNNTPPKTTETTPIKVIQPKQLTPTPNETNYSQSEPLGIVLSIDGGYSQLTTGVNPNTNQATQDFLKALRRGYGWGITGAFFFDELFGVGLSYTHFSSSESAQIFVQDTLLGGSTIEDYSNTISIQGAGINFLAKYSIDRKNILIGNFIMNITSLSQEIPITNQPLLIFTGTTVGSGFTGEYAYKFDPLLSIGARFSYHIAIFTSYDITYGNEQGSIDPVNYLFFYDSPPRDMSRFEFDIVLSAWF